MQNQKVKLIVALGKQNQIGLKGSMPWHLPEDLKNFKKTTLDNIVIMGRKTFESIGKPLPKRINFVITSNPGNINEYEVCLFPSLKKALEKAQKMQKEIYIIGGASIYNQALDLIDEMIITEVDYHGEADTYFPEINFDQWKEIERLKFEKNEKNAYPFDIVTYKKI